MILPFKFSLTKWFRNQIAIEYLRNSVLLPWKANQRRCWWAWTASKSHFANSQPHTSTYSKETKKRVTARKWQKRVCVGCLRISVPNYRPAGRMWTAIACSVARGRIQKKSSNLKFVERRVRLHVSHWNACAGWSAFSQEQWILPFLCTILLYWFIYFPIKLDGTARRYPSAGTPDWITYVSFRCPGVRCLEEYICRNELRTKK